jgi:adenosylcobinamide kinase/adenosylcobinamide-phosphate guanylyltransferase
MSTRETTLILGGVRSGKSRLAEHLARGSGLPVTYVATALAGDDEMRARIDAHRQRRPADWVLVEEPRRLAGTLAEVCADGRCVLVECLTLWLTNLLCADDATMLEHEVAALRELAPRLPGQVVFVGNEVNMGVIPMDELSRRYCDLAGNLHQALAADCHRVILTVAGLPLVVKGEPL